MFTNLYFGSSVATCRLACSEISLSINEKRAREKSEKWLDIVQFSRWRDALSSLALYSMF